METTGREDGRHIFLRLPEDSELCVTQYGGTRGRPHYLDVLLNGYVVVAGARHKSGRPYAALSPIVPPSELAEIPAELYQLLVTRASSRDRGVGVVEAPAKPVLQASQGLVPRPDVAAMLEDESDGRDRRSFVAVSRLVDFGWTDESIVSVFLGSPLGAKARQEGPWDPAGWVVHKIDSVRQLQAFDRAAYWIAAHTSGLTSAPLRVLDFLFPLAGRTSGVVGIGYTKIGLGSAMDQPRPIVKSLVAAGWLIVVKAADIASGRPTLYRLTVPRTAGTDDGAPQQLEGQGQEPHRPSLPSPPHPDEESSVWFMTSTTGHDAFPYAAPGAP